MMLFDAVGNVTEEALARDHAIATVEAHANPDWIAYARWMVERVARANEFFISDAVWEAGLPKVSESRALGPVMLWAKKQRFIEPTGRWEMSKQKGCNGMHRDVWHSLIYGGET